MENEGKKGDGKEEDRNATVSLQRGARFSLKGGRRSSVSSLETHNVGNQLQCLEVFDNVARLIGNNHSVELIHGLVDETNARSIDKRVLLAAIGDKLRESRQKTLYASPRYVDELSRDQS